METLKNKTQNARKIVKETDRLLTKIGGRVKRISTELKGLNEELNYIVNETPTGVMRNQLSNAIIFLSKSREELNGFISLTESDKPVENTIENDI